MEWRTIPKNGTDRSSMAGDFWKHGTSCDCKCAKPEAVGILLFFFAFSFPIPGNFRRYEIPMDLTPFHMCKLILRIHHSLAIVLSFYQNNRVNMENSLCVGASVTP